MEYVPHSSLIPVCLQIQLVIDCFEVFFKMLVIGEGIVIPIKENLKPYNYD